MRILHTADWHLGRIFHEVHLTEDQSYLLNQFTDLAIECKPDVILVTGDIYDRAVPPPEAVKLLDDTLNRIVTDIKCKVIMIAGNHDSPDRLSFGSRLFTSQGIYINGFIEIPIKPIILYDEFGPVYFYSLPYSEPSIVKEFTGNTTIHNHQSAFETIINQIRQIHPSGVRSVLCAHASVLGGIQSDSERPLTIGGSGLVDKNIFEDFSFVALGHLHGRQWQGDKIHYAGSLMKYSFSEVSHKKGATLIELGCNGQINYEYILLNPKRDLRIISGILTDIIKAGIQDDSPEDYIMVSLENQEPQLDAIGKLRQVYPNILHIERPRLFISDNSNTFDHRALSEIHLFDTFFQQTTGNVTTDEHKDFLQKTIDSLRQQEREAS